MSLSFERIDCILTVLSNIPRNSREVDRPSAFFFREGNTNILENLFESVKNLLLGRRKINKQNNHQARAKLMGSYRHSAESFRKSVQIFLSTLAPKGESNCEVECWNPFNTEKLPIRRMNCNDFEGISDMEDGDGSSRVARFMSLPWMKFCLHWKDTVTASGDTNCLPKAWAGTVVDRLKSEVVGMEFISWLEELTDW